MRKVVRKLDGSYFIMFVNVKTSERLRHFNASAEKAQNIMHSINATCHLNLEASSCI